MRRLSRTIFWTFFVLTAITFLVLFAGLRSYSALSKESLIAELSFEMRGDGGHNVLLTTGDRCTDNLYVIYGDQWRIDAQFIKWKYWANVVGADGRYRLERLQGRYATAVAENAGKPSAHELGGDGVIDMAQLAEWLGAFNPVFDAAYGSSTYQAIDTKRLYRVYKTQAGIISRSEPLLTPEIIGEFLDIEINKACGRDDSRLKQIFRSAR